MRTVELVVLLDVDNTLIDNDRVKADLASALERALGPERSARFRELYESVRSDTDVIDYPETLRRFAAEDPKDGDLVAGLVGGVRFADYLYPGALDAIADCWELATPVVLSDGDPVYQVAKISRSGITTAVHGNVLVYDHKERHIDDVLERFPADRFAVVDDKARVLSRLKRRLGSRLVTVHVRQGHYAGDSADGPPDRSIASIAELAPALREAMGVPAG